MSARTRRGTAALLAAGLVAGGCGRMPDLPVPKLGVPGLYRLDVRQGNALNDTAFARLEVGMERSKVVHLLGSPTIDDVFHPDRWEYLYSFAPDGEAGQWRHIVLHFEGERLVRVEGDVPPADAATTEPEAATVVEVPPRPAEKGFFRRIVRQVRDDG